MDADVARLVAEQRLDAAAELASERGDPRTASDLFERACAFSRAAREALRALDPERALLLAAGAGDAELASEATRRILDRPDHDPAVRVAGQLEQRGHPAWAAKLYEGAGRTALAARAFERGGEPVRAAALLEASDPAHAAKILEGAARREPDRWEVHVALGSLLLRYGKVEAAVRALQKVPREALEHRAALTYLVPALAQLGLSEATNEAARALASHGGPIEGATLERAATGPKSRLFGRYDVARTVASSASARVLECYDGVRREKVAVKIFAAHDARGAGRDALARFEREVRVTGALEHPNVVPLRDYLPEGPALVLAWMSGGTLEARIALGDLAPARAVEIACAVLDALGEAHRLDILHRDIKPANVLFDEAGVARLSDFGAAHLGDLSATATAGVFGTLAYMSPEQREGRPATAESDLFGVGILLFEMLTGERPGRNAPRTLPSGAHRQLDARHDAAVLRLFAQDPSARPEGAFAARRELLSLPWPNAVDPASFAKRPSAIPDEAPSVRPSADRLERAEDGTWIDKWLDRPIVRVAGTRETRARAASFARAAHPSLQIVLRVDPERDEIWLDPPRGEPASSPLTEAREDEARAAVDALHGAGLVHGNLDADHVRIDDDGVTVLFAPSAHPDATREGDRAALDLLFGPRDPGGAR